MINILLPAVTPSTHVHPHTHSLSNPSRMTLPSTRRSSYSLPPFFPPLVPAGRINKILICHIRVSPESRARIDFLGSCPRTLPPSAQLTELTRPCPGGGRAHKGPNVQIMKFQRRVSPSSMCVVDERPRDQAGERVPIRRNLYSTPSANSKIPWSMYYTTSSYSPSSSTVVLRNNTHTRRGNLRVAR